METKVDAMAAQAGDAEEHAQFFERLARDLRAKKVSAYACVVVAMSGAMEGVGGSADDHEAQRRAQLVPGLREMLRVAEGGEIPVQDAPQKPGMVIAKG